MVVRGLENLVMNQDTPKLQKQGQQSEASQGLTPIGDVMQLKARFLADLEKNEMASRRRLKKLNKRLHRLESGVQGAKATASPTSTRRAFPEPSMSGSRFAVSQGKKCISHPQLERKHNAMLRSETEGLCSFLGQAENDNDLSDASWAPDVEHQAEGALVLAKYSVAAFKPKNESVKAETQTELQPYADTDVEVEMSCRIARLEM
jgi:hypothetical protein